MDCLFCRIISREIPTKILAEDDFTITVLDVNPRSPGHSMVLPKFHVESILDLRDEQIGPVFKAVQGITNKLVHVFRPDGFTIGINHGRAAGQAVDHLHVHVIPRWNNDKGTSIHGVVNNTPVESLEEIAKKIISFGG